MEGSADAPTPQLTSELTRLLDGALRVEDFVATVVHEAMQPLTAIQVLAGAIRQGGDSMPPAERDKLLADIESQARFLQDLTDWMLRPFTRDRVAFDELVAGTVERCRPLAPGHTLVARLECGDTIISCEAVRVEASIRNLVKNSAANSPAGSEIEISTRTTGDHLIVSVKDHGCGIPVARWEDVFRRFNRVESGPSEGSGLGLFVVHSCAIQHGGYARVADSSAAGTTVELALGAGVT
ncbi:MAG: ATP-binding protein [Solirubrobacterales bacterium]